MCSGVVSFSLWEIDNSKCLGTTLLTTPFPSFIRLTTPVSLDLSERQLHWTSKGLRKRQGPHI